jgi:hypothetical protein
MDADRDLFMAANVAEDERYVLLEARAVTGLRRPENVGRELPEAGRELGGSNPPRLGLRPDHPVGDVHLNVSWFVSYERP